MAFVGIALAIGGGASIGVVAAVIVWLLQEKDIRPANTFIDKRFQIAPRGATSFRLPKKTSQELIASLVKTGYLQ
jgi:hypothetical protein